MQVIPQLIARIDHHKRVVSKLIHDLLTDVGKQHPQVRGGGIMSGGAAAFEGAWSSNIPLAVGAWSCELFQHECA